MISILNWFTQFTQIFFIASNKEYQTNFSISLYYAILLLTIFFPSFLMHWTPLKSLAFIFLILTCLQILFSRSILPNLVYN